MSNLVVILGAGFSFPAGLPLANDINTRFNRIQKEKLLRMGSGEWMWEDEKDATTIHNGKIGFDHLAYSYILNEIVNTYNNEVAEFDNYEVFFSYVLDKFDDLDWFKGVYARAKVNLIEDKPYLVTQPLPHSDYLLIFDKDPHIRKIQDIFNYLIGDMLFVSDSSIDDSLGDYNHFINFIQTYDRVDIFTLNHDLLLEKILGKKSISFCRGFSFDKSDVYYEDKPLPIFNNYFEDKINIHKLHGSIDFFRFQHFEKGEGLFWTSTDKYNYFVTHGYRAKHYAVRVDPITKETLQDMNFDVSPKFITGTKKTDIIKNDIMFSSLFNNYKESMKAASEVLISGYSYSDEHINRELENRTDIEVINQNPSNYYPFKTRKLTQIESLVELSNLI